MYLINLKLTNFIFSFIIFFIGISHIGTPIFVDILISLIGAITLCSWVKSLATVTIILILNIFLNSIYQIQIDYRANEMLATKDGVYVKNQNIIIQQPYGDLIAVTKNHKDFENLIEPREIEFITDKLGYRNRKLFKSPDLILVGDSFIVGNGVTQNEILSEQLSIKNDIDVYSLSYPGGPKTTRKM